MEQAFSLRWVQVRCQSSHHNYPLAPPRSPSIQPQTTVTTGVTASSRSTKLRVCLGLSQMEPYNTSNKFITGICWLWHALSLSALNKINLTPGQVQLHHRHEGRYSPLRLYETQLQSPFGSKIIRIYSSKVQGNKKIKGL